VGVGREDKGKKKWGEKRDKTGEKIRNRRKLG
jgi:hypothetical protein